MNIFDELKAVIETWPDNIKNNVEIVTSEQVGTDVLIYAGYNIRGMSHSAFVDEEHAKRIGFSISKLVCYTTKEEATTAYFTSVREDAKFTTVFNFRFEACIRPGAKLRQFVLPNEYWLLGQNDLSIISRELSVPNTTLSAVLQASIERRSQRRMLSLESEQPFYQKW